MQGETEKEAKDYFDYYVHQKGDWEAATNLVETWWINAKTLPADTLRAMKMHFMAGWGGYPLIGTRGADRRRPQSVCRTWASTARC